MIVRWECQFCYLEGEGRQARDDHAAWHIEFLLAQRTETAFDILETPIPFKEVHDE